MFFSSLIRISLARVKNKGIPTGKKSPHFSYHIAHPICWFLMSWHAGPSNPWVGSTSARDD